jgi:hypothetical protein
MLRAVSGAAAGQPISAAGNDTGFCVACFTGNYPIQSLTAPSGKAALDKRHLTVV